MKLFLVRFEVEIYERVLWNTLNQNESKDDWQFVGNQDLANLQICTLFVLLFFRECL